MSVNPGLHRRRMVGPYTAVVVVTVFVLVLVAALVVRTVSLIGGP